MRDGRIGSRMFGAPKRAFSPECNQLLQRKCACGGTLGPTGECESCRKKRLQRSFGNPSVPSSINHAPSSVSEVPPIVHEVLRSPGQPLDTETRAFMEQRFAHDFSLEPLRVSEVGHPHRLTVNLPGDQFEREAEMVAGVVMRKPDVVGARHLAESQRGFDFSRVRVHADAKAAQGAQAVRARAYTVGHNIVFGSGQYAPTLHEGRSLLAHELAHVIQQGRFAAPVRIQRFDWGPWGLGSKCCNTSPEGGEWALVGDGTWASLPSGECTGDSTDCDGMTCGGGFYYVGGFQCATCKTPRQDSAMAHRRRWTPTQAGSDAKSPKEKNAPGNVPPGYSYDEQ